MAATIDHLRIDHHVVVRAPFTDARGITHQVDDHGVLRGMGLDAATMELWIEWEYQGVSERMHFPVRAPSGPANGRMRDFFTLGPEATPLVPCDDAPAVPDAPEACEPVPQLGASNAPAGTNLGERAVACACAPAFHRPVLHPGSGVSACLRCGTVTCSHTIGDDGRFTGTSWHASVVDDISAPVLHWLALWPRVIVRASASDAWYHPPGLRQEETIYLPADARCTTATEVRALEERSRGTVADVVFPSQPAPGPLPSRFSVFAGYASAVRLTPASDRDALLRAANPYHRGGAVAVAKLLQRRDADGIMLDALESDDAQMQGAGAAMAFAAPQVHPRLPDVLCRVLGSLPLSVSSERANRVVGGTRCLELVTVIARHRIRTPEVRAALAQAQRRVARLDAELAMCIGTVLRDVYVAAGTGTP